MSVPFSEPVSLSTERRLDHIESFTARVGPYVTRYSIVLLLLLFGALKWTKGEAVGIQPMVEHSPLWGWLYPQLGVQGTSIFFGVFELLAGVAIALRPWRPLLSAAGSAFGVLMFLMTLSFLFTTPGLASSPDSGFIMKDLVLLGGSIWCVGEALGAHRQRVLARRDSTPRR